MYFDMGAFYKVSKLFSFTENFLPLSSRLLVTACIQSCLVALLQVRSSARIQLISCAFRREGEGQVEGGSRLG